MYHRLVVKPIMGMACRSHSPRLSPMKLCNWVCLATEKAARNPAAKVRTFLKCPIPLDGAKCVMVGASMIAVTCDANPCLQNGTVVHAQPEQIALNKWGIGFSECFACMLAGSKLVKW